ncbi:putative uncharacterized protein ENSP00000383309 [Bombina bombina]|uniref:putative uncharacterized protein ENSP00000383309 n=1 Tax=Bombina bombina TaxID=8345 RepID=UPI00235ACA9B|nr:putative uncharacterized protein ENSP00000383309 [Bombina bombina]XP_053558559.1 putative uncharacterized protein ENSP00000383309 [Bombina bombina]XP_053558560.1 putative uncharacterized protein ENSP00000383309 [Bombina bombina]XP_053558561.1 putative uncharacterized protein ENSP00000383309 [Bombina bombina]
MTPGKIPGQRNIHILALRRSQDSHKGSMYLPPQTHGSHGFYPQTMSQEVPIGQAEWSHTGHQWDYQSTMRTPPSSSLGRAPPSSSLGRAPPSSSIGQAPQSSSLGRAPPSSSLWRVPPSSSLGRAPPSSSLGRAPPSSSLGRAPPSSSLGQAPPSSSLGQAPPSADGNIAETTQAPSDAVEPAPPEPSDAAEPAPPEPADAAEPAPPEPADAGDPAPQAPADAGDPAPQATRSPAAQGPVVALYSPLGEEYISLQRRLITSTESIQRGQERFFRSQERLHKRSIELQRDMAASLSASVQNQSQIMQILSDMQM